MQWILFANMAKNDETYFQPVRFQDTTSRATAENE